jgi:hypothetical protein
MRHRRELDGEMFGLARGTRRHGVADAFVGNVQRQASVSEVGDTRTQACPPRQYCPQASVACCMNTRVRGWSCHLREDSPCVLGSG